MLTDNDRLAIEYVLTHIKPFGISAVWLYGSKARGDATEWSDIDLLILTHNKISYQNECDLLNIVHDSELKHGVIFGAIVFDIQYWQNQPNDSPFKSRVLNEGRAA